MNMKLWNCGNMKIWEYGYALLCILISTGACAADWRDDMWKGPVALRDGVTVRAYALESPRMMKAYVARIVLTTPGLGFTATERAPDWGRRIDEVTNRICLSETVLETTADFMARRRLEGRNVEIAFNTTPWAPFPQPAGCEVCDPLGWCVSDGVEVSRANSRPVFLVRRDGSAEILPAPPENGLGDTAFAVAGFDMILSNGEDVACVNRSEEEGTHPRLALGLTADRNTLVILAVDGRQAGYSLGAEMRDLRDILRREGVTDAVNMDGGGSVSLVAWDRKASRPSMLNRHPRGGVRAIAFNMGIVFGAENSANDVERSASVFHTYAFEPVRDTPAPDGFAPFYIAHYGRHGSRRQTGTVVAETLAMFEEAESQGLLTELGLSCLSDVRRIAAVHEGMIGQLADRGAEEHRTLARRMAERFPGVFAGARRVRCQSAVYHRVLISQANFTMALKDAAPGLDFDFTTGAKYQNLLNGLLLVRAESGIDKQIAAATSAYAAEIIDPAPLAKRLFADAGAPKDACRFARKLFAVASICPCLRSELGGLDIYRYFTAREIDALGRVLTADHYARMGNSEEFGYIALRGSRDLACDVVRRADEAVADDRIAADLRFGHDSGLWPLAALIGLEGPGDRVPFAAAWEKCPGWKWMPMAANMQMVFYRNRTGEVLVKILYNEREVFVRGLKPFDGPYYRWSELRESILRAAAGES